MIELNEFKNEKVKNKNTYISLCGKLEAMIGNYFLSGVSVPEQAVETLYYDGLIDIDDSVELIKENIVAYFLADESIAIVKKDMLEKLQNDTKEYGITYIAVDNFETEILFVNQEKELPEYLNEVVWIDDDFLRDESIPFDYEAFEIIDSKVEYLNPKHFSVIQLIRVLESSKNI